MSWASTVWSVKMRLHEDSRRNIMADSSVTFFHIAELDENDDDLTHDETETITALVAAST